MTLLFGMSFFMRTKAVFQKIDAFKNVKCVRGGQDAAVVYRNEFFSHELEPSQ